MTKDSQVILRAGLKHQDLTAKGKGGRIRTVFSSGGGKKYLRITMRSDSSYLNDFVVGYSNPVWIGKLAQWMQTPGLLPFFVTPNTLPFSQKSCWPPLSPTLVI